MAQTTKSITVRVSPELHRELKVFVANTGISLQEYITKLIEEDMKKKEGKE